jgi:hypothetical protein
MSICKRLLIVVLWIGSLIAVGTAAYAQASRMTPLPSPVVLTGNDIGFRVEGQIRDTPAGSLVIRVNGQWVAPLAPTGPARLAAH